MAEIKSTLDLVLERTRNLSMTAEEKEALQRKELDGKIRGLAQKNMDGLIDLKTMNAEMAAIPENRRNDGRKMLKDLVLEHFDPEGDNEKIYKVLKGVLGESLKPYQAAARAFQTMMAAERSGFLEALQAKLAERQVSGSAVTPNLSRDEAWGLFHQKALEKFRRGIALTHPDS